MKQEKFIQQYGRSDFKTFFYELFLQFQQIYRQDWAVIRMLIMCALLLALILTCVIIEIATSEYTKLPPEIAKHNKTYHLRLVDEINSRQKQWTVGFFFHNT